MEAPRSGLWATVLSALLRPAVRFLDRHSQPLYSGDLLLDGLKDTVEIRWDRHAVPRVRAHNERDLFFAQGFLHAQERLWQMELSRRFLSGRMGEIFGNFPLPWRDLSTQFRGRTSADFDFFVRLLGIRHAAAASAALMTESEIEFLQAYSDGINRFIERCGKKLPWEFRLLRHQPEPWRIEDTLAISKGLSFLLSTALYSRLNFLAVAARLDADPALLRALAPCYPEDGPKVAKALWNAARELWEFTTWGLAESGVPSAGHGSNAWVLAPHRSTTGAALLANDPHLRMTLPSVWYLMRLRAQGEGNDMGYEVQGATIPGIPFVQIGHNRKIAWGVTAALCDDVELYREKIHPGRTDFYRYREDWLEMSRRTERIAIRGKGIIEKTIRLTRHGPLISDFCGAANSGEALSVRWTAQEASRELGALYHLNRAQNWPEFLQSLAQHSSPSLNFLYADVDGNIGYALAGKIPIRREVPTLLPLDGWRDENEWRGYICWEEMPRLFNPPGGAIVSANHKIVDSTYPYYLSDFFEPPHRAQRIEQLLAARVRHSPADLATMQLDALSLHARQLVESLRADLEAVDDEPLAAAAAERLLRWDGDCSASSVEAAIYHVWHHRLLWNLLEPALGAECFAACVEILNQCIAPTDAILQDERSSWFRRRSRRDLVALSLKEACGELKKLLGANVESWLWGKIHLLLLNHSLGRIAALRPLLAIGPMASPGDGMTVNLGFYRHSNPYNQTVGASLRYLADLSGLDQSRWVLPSGQSGHPLSPHYADQTPLWRQGETITCFASSNGTGALLRLRPAKAY